MNRWKGAVDMNCTVQSIAQNTIFLFLLVGINMTLPISVAANAKICQWQGRNYSLREDEYSQFVRYPVTDVGRLLAALGPVLEANRQIESHYLKSFSSTAAQSPVFWSELRQKFMNMKGILNSIQNERENLFCWGPFEILKSYWVGKVAWGDPEIGALIDQHKAKLEAWSIQFNTVWNSTYRLERSVDEVLTRIKHAEISIELGKMVETDETEVLAQWREIWQKEAAYRSTLEATTIEWAKRYKVTN
ncbi:MAG: hypothetical protein AB7G93_21065 [Bdellovibrionales bacterium]